VTKGRNPEKRFEAEFDNPLKKPMHPWGWVLLAAFSSGFLRAEVPMDMDSPFPKTALLQDKTGKKEERDIQSAKLTGDKVELRYPGGGVGVFPRGEIMAIFPRLPNPGQEASLEQIDRALRFLEGLTEEFQGRPEVSADTLQRWRELRKPAEEALERKRRADQQALETRKSEEAALVKAWMSEASEISRPRSEAELDKLKQAGEKFLTAGVGNENKIRDLLFALSQVSGKEKGEPLPELSKLDEIQATVAPDDLLVWLATGIFLVSLFGLLAATSFVTTGLTRLREGALLGGFLYGGVGLGIFYGLFLVWWSQSPQGVAWESEASPQFKQMALFAKNRVKPVYFFPEQEFELTPREFVTGLMATLRPHPEKTGLFKGSFQEGKLWIQPKEWIWRQPVTVLALPFPLVFSFSGKFPVREKWSEVTADRVTLGRLSLPGFLVASLGEGISSSFRSGLAAGGFQGVELARGTGESVMVKVPASGTRPVLKKTEAVQSVSKQVYRKDISAEDLAQSFIEGKGGEFFGKFVVVDGIVEKVSSGSEYSPSALQENSTKAAPKIAGDRFDVFYLRGAEHYGFRKDPLYIRCVVKSPLVFSMDSYGDVYMGTNVNVVKEKAWIKKGKRVRFLKEGRVQSEEIRNNEIEVYGIELDDGGSTEIQVFETNASGSP